MAHKAAKQPSLPGSGSLQPTLGKPYDDKAALLISASFTDKGGIGIKPLTGTGSAVLRSNNVGFEGVIRMKGYEAAENNGTVYMVPPRGDGWFSLDHVDLSGVNGAEMTCGYEKAPTSGYLFELRLDAPDGKLLSSAALLPPTGKSKQQVTLLTLKFNGFDNVTDGKFHSLYIVSRPKDDKETEQVGLGRLRLIAH